MLGYKAFTTTHEVSTLIVTFYRLVKSTQGQQYDSVVREYSLDADLSADEAKTWAIAEFEREVGTKWSEEADFVDVR